MRPMFATLVLLYIMSGTPESGCHSVTANSGVKQRMANLPQIKKLVLTSSFVSLINCVVCQKNIVTVSRSILRWCSEFQEVFRMGFPARQCFHLTVDHYLH